MKMSVSRLIGEGLGRAMATAGKRNSAAWMEAIAEMLEGAKLE